jgi:response regulator RpfG family c-di-GMP phosphodiesterase
MSKKPIILYVDDEDINQMLFEINFKKDYTVITAGNGFEGLQILKQNPAINIVVSDMRMPILNGIEFIQKAKEIQPKLPFFLLTGFDITPQISEALESKLIHSHLKKPFDIEAMHAAFSKALSL